MLSLLSNPLVKFILPYALAFAAVFGVYTYAHHTGYTKAKSECHDAALRSEVKARELQIENLKKQLDDTQTALTEAQGKKQIIIKKVIEAKQVVQNEVKDDTSCDVGTNVIGMLNNIRASNNNK